ncbi:unnamed protein product [Caenorhabditis angaria]|uniref:Uncharacterized protein n=1 Tax=Caenorhabditis angaria TaxID=860376 RepID=A0A9P1IZF7_9PELO|nr:unnamed protein product [Caenorhabditis angaria]
MKDNVRIRPTTSRRSSPTICEQFWNCKIPAVSHIVETANSEAHDDYWLIFGKTLEYSAAGRSHQLVERIT